MFGVAYFDIAPGGEKVSVAPVARRHNAVKQVYAPQDAFHQIHRAHKFYDPKIAWRDVGGAPLHPGAERFYRENGYLN